MLLNDYNELQLNAIKSEANKICVYAGSGNGKTKTLVGKYVYLPKKMGIFPLDILCLTFTKKLLKKWKRGFVLYVVKIVLSISE